MQLLHQDVQEAVPPQGTSAASHRREAAPVQDLQEAFRAIIYSEDPPLCAHGREVASVWLLQQTVRPA